MRAKGIPDRSDLGSFDNIEVGAILPLYVQEHIGQRAGLHYDVRLGDGKRGLLSWAVRKGVPDPKGKHLALRQPLHDASYGKFSGMIAGGYGAGQVKLVAQHRVLVTGKDDRGISFVTADEKSPQRFRLQHTSGFGRKGQEAWLFMNTTPTALGPYQKERFRQKEDSDVEEVFSPSNRVSQKLDGAASWLETRPHGVEVLSYRTSKRTGLPIVHTERAGLAGMKIEGLPQNTTLRGEMVGQQGGKLISAAQLGGLLNSTIENSLQAQKDRGILVRQALFDVVKHKGKSLEDMPYKDRLKILRNILEKLPPDVFFEPRGTQDPEQQRKLWERVRSGKDPYTREGVVSQPLEGGAPTKVKTYPEADVLIRQVFEGAGKFKGKAGGFEYALPEDPEKVVGRVGTGFSDADRADMFAHPEEWIDRIARLRAQEQFPSGAYRAPGFLARHESR